MRNRNFLKVAVIVFFVLFFISFPAPASAQDDNSTGPGIEVVTAPQLKELETEFKKAVKELYLRVKQLEADDPNRETLEEEVSQLREEVALLTKSNATMQQTLGLSDPNIGSTRLNNIESDVKKLVAGQKKGVYIYFPPGKYNIDSSDAKRVLAYIKDIGYTRVFSITGNASPEWDSLPSVEADKKNLALAIERARAVKEYLSSAGLEVPAEEPSAAVSNRYGSAADNRVVAIILTR